MQYRRYRDFGAGFGVISEPGDELRLLGAGEIWAPRSWSIHSHAHAGWEVYIQSVGGSVWQIGDEKREVREGGAYLIRPGVQHRLLRFTQEKVHFSWFIFEEEGVPEGVRDSECWRQPFSILPSAHGFSVPASGLIQELAVREKWQSSVCKWYLAALCAGVARRAEEDREEQLVSRHPGAERAMRLLLGRLGHPWRLEELARLSGISVPHLIEVFQVEYGQTPMRALQGLRLEEARRQLEQTDRSVIDIAMDVGLASSQHLARLCRQRFRKTPTQLRAGAKD